MLDPKHFEDLAKKICDKLPKGMLTAKKDMESAVKSMLQTTFDKLDLVTRKEFESQEKQLSKCKERLQKIEKHVSELEHSHTKKKAKKK